MSLLKRRYLLVLGLLATPLAAVLISCLRFCGNRPDGGGVWDRTLAGHTLPVQALVFDADGDTLTTVACHYRATHHGVEVATWDVGTGQHGATHTVSLGELLALSFAPGACTLAASGRDGTLQLWDTAISHEPMRLARDPFLRSACGMRPAVNRVAPSGDMTGRC
jgi:WD40 repeat protein